MSRTKPTSISRRSIGATSKSSDTEDSVEKHLRLRVKKLRGVCIKLPAILLNGIPDRIVLLSGGRVAFAELKRPKGGRYEPLQRWWHLRLRKLGFRVVVLRTKEAVEEFLESMQ